MTRFSIETQVGWKRRGTGRLSCGARHGTFEKALNLKIQAILDCNRLARRGHEASPAAYCGEVLNLQMTLGVAARVHA
jgi:hypothetical protein